MSADFWAGYLSGAVGIIVGNPLDVIKVRVQARDALAAAPSLAAYAGQFETARVLVSGSAAPILGYGALNALLFVSYNRTEALLNKATVSRSLWSTWIAGAVGGLATWVVSTPTELIKCRAQLPSPPVSSWTVAKQVWRAEGVKGLYFGGVVTALRDSIGYGFYFWSYELSTQYVTRRMGDQYSLGQEAAKVLLCGGLAGIVTWASIFPLDVVKTRVQTQPFVFGHETTPLLSGGPRRQGRAYERFGAREAAKRAYQDGGVSVFFRGLTVCSIRAFVVNAVQWAVYEGIMYELGHGRKQRRIQADVK
jgi:solute carrier family 25 (mitochondrial carnitine/acylcarnitine transporter), member 20/29